MANDDCGAFAYLHRVLEEGMRRRNRIGYEKCKQQYKQQAHVIMIVYKIK